MKRIEIETSEGKKYAAEFETQAELDSWKQSQISKGRWTEDDITFEGDKVIPYDVARKTEYLKLDDMLKEAIAEKEAGDSTKMTEYLALRAQIKADHPKPE